MPPRTEAGARVRALAARLNADVVMRGQSLAALRIDADDLAERDRALLRALLQGSLRWHHRFDRELAGLLDRPLKPRDALLAALLRIGLTQLEALRIPDHAAVASTVAAATELGFAHARGLVNAVLRRYLRERDTIAERTAADEVARYSHPGWLIEAIRHDWPDRWQTVLEANNALPPLWLRVNRLKVDRDAYQCTLRAAGLDATKGSSSDDALLMSEPCPVAELPGFDDGLVSVQDAAAQLAALLMQLAPGQRVLDACAAPGGKTAHMLEICPGLEQLVAIDDDAARLGQVRQNLDRLGLEAELVEGDAGEPSDWFDGRRFDRILLDAPCSSTGVIRRHPDIKILRRASDIAPLASNQARLLDALWALLEPGGRLVYATCSVLAAENTAVVGRFLERTADAAAPPFGSAGHFALTPGETNTDGFYYACLTKDSRQ